MGNSASNVSLVDEPQSSSAQIGQDMDKTRDSITDKVAALETQVLGTFQPAADTVTGTVDAVKDAVTATPLAIRDTVQDVVGVVKPTAGSFGLNDIIRSHPVTALSSSILAGVAVGLSTGASSR